MTVVYIDSLFLLNFIVNYALLLASARLSGARLRRLRLAAAAALGALYAVLVFFPGMGFLLYPLCKGCAAVFMVLAAFGGERRLLRIFLVFLALACAFGGGIFAIGLLGGRGLSLKNGILYSGLDLKLILLSAAGCYAIITFVFERLARHSGTDGELVQVTVVRGGKSVLLTALADSGNTLTDPVTGNPVLVAEGERLLPLLPARMDARAFLDPVKTLEGLSGTKDAQYFRLLPYRAVGISCGMLLAVRTDWIEAARLRQKNVLVALSPTPLSDGGGYQALISPDHVGRTEYDRLEAALVHGGPARAGPAGTSAAGKNNVYRRKRRPSPSADPGRGERPDLPAG